MDIEEIKLYRKLLLQQIADRLSQLNKLPTVYSDWVYGDVEYRQNDTWYRQGDVPGHYVSVYKRNVFFQEGKTQQWQCMSPYLANSIFGLTAEEVKAAVDVALLASGSLLISGNQ